MHVLTLKSLRFDARHGYYEQERTEGNTFEVDVIFTADLREAAATDDLQKTIDYQQAEEIVKSVMNGPSLKLIETLTGRIGDQLFEAFEEVTALEVRVRKLAPPLSTTTEYSEVSMTWNRQ